MKSEIFKDYTPGDWHGFRSNGQRVELTHGVKNTHVYVWNGAKIESVQVFSDEKQAMDCFLSELNK